MARVAALKGDDKSESLAGLNTVPVMTGTHFHALDEKGRVIVPAKLRQGLTTNFWMMLDENDNIAMYDYTTGLEVLEYCERQQAENPGNQFIADAIELITGSAEQIAVEGDAWRVPVSEILRFRAQMDKEIVTVGVLNKAVMWSRERWEESQLRRESPEVRRAQAEMLRAAASQIKKPEVPKIAERVEEVAAKEAGNAAATGREAIASSGDGRRGSRVLTLSQLGR